MALFDDSTLKGLTTSWSAVTNKDYSRSSNYFNKYEDQFIAEVMETVLPQKEAISKKLSWLCKMHAEDIEVPLFSYNMTKIGDNKSKVKGISGKKKFSETETYREAAIRLGYNKLCKPLPEVQMITEKDAEGNDVTYEEGPAPFHLVYEFTGARYKIAEKFGDSFTIIKKWRATKNDAEDFGKANFVKTFQVTLFLKFYPLGITDDDWIAKKPASLPSIEVSESS